MEAKRWCFTINNPTFEDEAMILGRDGEEPQANYGEIQYLIFQEERGENGTIHWQGFLYLKKKKKLTWLKRNINPRAHFEITRGTDQQARDYCRKEETYTGGRRYEYGSLPERAAAPAKKQAREMAIEQLDIAKDLKTYIKLAEVDSSVLLCPGFIQCWKELMKNRLGPHRNVQVITVVGPPGTGKSWAAFKFFQDHALMIYGNSGQWTMNPLADCLLFEEFHGQIPLAKMLQFLDGYPYALEVKGGLEPAMYTTVVITSNTKPCDWYPLSIEDRGKPEYQRKIDAIHALYDRLGYNPGDYIPVRHTGHYFELPSMEHVVHLGLNRKEYIEEARKSVWLHFKSVTGRDPSDGEEEESATMDALPDEATQDLP